METVVPPTDDEREDGEIVDEFEDISDSSIPSCGGKSDYSQDILRAISLSSISDNSDRAEMSLRKRHKKRHRCKTDHPRRKKKHKHDGLLRVPRKRRSLSTSSSSSNSDKEKLDKRMLRQLKEAVRINQSGELHHNSLRSRLKAMIEPDSQDEEDVEALRTLALLTKNENSLKPDFKEGELDDNEVRDMEVDDDKDPPGEIIEKTDDPLNDKELAELRSEALKSAMMKKHMERKKRKEQDQKENNKDLQNEALNSNDKENKDENEEDVDVMRAMLLASISKRITSAPKNPTCKPAITSTPNPVARAALQNKQTNSKPVLPLKLPSVKPLIIRLNSDSDSDLDKSSEGNNNVQQVNNPLDETVSKLLRMHREKFEAKEKEIEKSGDVKDENLLDKSVVKLLSKSQQREYQLLKQKLLLANKKKVRKLSNRARSSKKDEEKSVPNSSNLKETLQEMQFQIDGRLQMKGKYKELAPLIQRVNVASERKKRCEDTIKGLLAKLKEARVEHADSHDNFISLVQKLKQAKENIDLRLTKLATANTNTGLKPQPPTSAILKQASLESTPMLPAAKEIDVVNQNLTNSTEICKIVQVESQNMSVDVEIKMGVDSQIMMQTNLVQVNTVGQKKRNGAVVEKDLVPAKVQKITNSTDIQKVAVLQKKTVPAQIQNKLITSEMQKKEEIANTQEKLINVISKQAQQKMSVATVQEKIVQKKMIPVENRKNSIVANAQEITNSTEIQIKMIPTENQSKLIPDNQTKITPALVEKQTNSAIVQKSDVTEQHVEIQTNTFPKEIIWGGGVISTSPKQTIPVLIHRKPILATVQQKINPVARKLITNDDNEINPVELQKKTVSTQSQKKINSTKVQKKPISVEVPKKINSTEIKKITIPAEIQKKINPAEVQTKINSNEGHRKTIPAKLENITIENKPDTNNQKKTESVKAQKKDSEKIIPAETENKINPVEVQKELSANINTKEIIFRTEEKTSFTEVGNDEGKGTDQKEPILVEAKIKTSVIDLTSDDDVTICDEENIPTKTLKLEKQMEQTPNNQTTDSHNNTDAINKRQPTLPDDKISSTSVEIKFLEYISPLDRRNQISSNNPQQMLCPYELFGTCRDQDCVFNHCP